MKCVFRWNITVGGTDQNYLLAANTLEQRDLRVFNAAEYSTRMSKRGWFTQRRKGRKDRKGSQIPLCAFAIFASLREPTSPTEVTVNGTGLV
jgi:hypothetical protein